jgi:hypothetical protein
VRSVPAIAFDFRVSRSLIGACAAAGLLAIAAIALCGLDGCLRLALAFATGAYAAFALSRLVRAPFDHVVWHPAGHWRLRVCEGDEIVAEFVGATMLGPLIVLRLRNGPGRVTPLCLLPDNCADDTRRRLRVRLARGATSAAAPG